MAVYNQDKYYTEQVVQAHEISEVEECMQLVIDKLGARHAREFLQQGTLQRILIDLEEIRMKSPKAYKTVYLALTMYPTSYSKIGKKRNVSKVAVFKQLKLWATKYDWIFDLTKAMSND